MKKTIQTDQAPAAIGPYSQAVQAGDWLFVSGQIPIDPTSGSLVAGSAAEQARYCLDNLKAILDSADYALTDVVKVTLFIADMDEFGSINEIYATYFQKDPPARACVEVARLPKDFAVEIEAIAYRPSY